ncbi:MAG: hypothetical protein ACJ74W_12655 [Pyrinomonadaceae bacterium]
MFKRTFAMMLTAIFTLTALSIQPARAQTSADTQLAMKARTKVQKMGTGRAARVEVKLRDNTKLKGYVSAADENSFTVTDTKTGAMQTVAYADVAQVKKPGGGLSTRSWIIIGGALAAAVIAGIVIKPALCDGGAQTRFPC